MDKCEQLGGVTYVGTAGLVLEDELMLMPGVTILSFFSPESLSDLAAVVAGLRVAISCESPTERVESRIFSGQMRDFKRDVST